MAVEKIHTLVIGGGQAGIAMSEHLSNRKIEHLVLEKNRIAENWRTARWDSLVANGPSWHDRFPNMEFSGFGPDDFVPKEKVADYLLAYAAQIDAPVRCGVEATRVEISANGSTFRVETTQGIIEAEKVVVATGPFQHPIIPAMVADDQSILQIHSSLYRNPEQLPASSVLVVGGGSSGTQIAEELMLAGRQVHLSLGPHDRPPRRYRNRDFCWWLGVLGIWDLKVPAPNTEHVTIAVSGAYGGKTVDFRRLAARGMSLLGRAQHYSDGVMHFAADLASNIAAGDANYLALLKRADAYVAEHGLDLPEEPQAYQIDADPQCVTHPVLSLNLKQEGITSIIWATGFARDYSFIKLNAFDNKARPVHERGVANVPGLYFIGLPWLSRRASSFIWGVWHDADYIAGHIAAQNQVT